MNTLPLPAAAAAPTSVPLSPSAPGSAVAQRLAATLPEIPEGAAPLTGGLGPVIAATLAADRDPQTRRALRRVCPPAPGVYWMHDAAGRIVYVGKSRALRHRLSTYLAAREPEAKEWRIMEAATGLAFEVWPDEFGCMLREIELIQGLRPRFNVQFNPGRKRRGYVCLTSGEAPHFAVAAERPPRGSAHVIVGPLPRRSRLEVLCEIMNDQLGLADCPRPVALRFAGEQGAAAAREARPGCHRHAVHECLGPCVAACTRSAYGERVEAARAFLLGKDLSAMRALQARMLASAEALQFEQAARQRDQWALVRWVVRRMRLLRRTRRGFHAIYAAPGRVAGERTWYLIRGGVVVAVLPAPSTPATRAAAMALLRRVYTVRQGRATYPDALEGENLELVARWFRDRPEERAHLVAPEAAIAELAAQPLDRSDA